MATITIRNLPAVVIGRIKKTAKRRGRSMEQEIRDLLESRYGEREAVLERIRKRWETMPETSADEIDTWRVGDRR